MFAGCQELFYEVRHFLVDTGPAFWDSARVKFNSTVKCKRCGYVWLPRSIVIAPRACAGCHSPNWQTKPKRKKANAKRIGTP
jgi:hypothetical protein